MTHGQSCHPAPKDTPTGTLHPQEEQGRVHTVPRDSRALPTRALFTQHSPRAPQESKLTLPVSAAPTWHLPGPAGLGPHQGAVSTPIPAGTSPGTPSKDPPHSKPSQPFHQLQPCPHPTRLSGPCARFPGQGWGGLAAHHSCEPAWGRPRANSFPSFVFSCKSTRKLSAAAAEPRSGAVRAHEIFTG